MGKTFGGVNSKAQEGRERKAAQKEVKKRGEEERREARETQEWAVGAKTRSARQAQEEERRNEKSEKRRERERLEAEEAAELAKLKPLKPLPKEKSSGGAARGSNGAALCARQPSPAQSATSTTASSSKGSREPSIAASDDTPMYSASNIDDALFLLDGSAGTPRPGAVERHPERRAKAAFAAYEAREMPILRLEHPGLRLSQLRERLHRMWLKAPENPFNQTYIHYNATRSQEAVTASGDIAETLQRLCLPSDRL